MKPSGSVRFPEVLQDRRKAHIRSATKTPCTGYGINQTRSLVSQNDFVHLFLTLYFHDFGVPQDLYVVGENIFGQVLLSPQLVSSVHQGVIHIYVVEIEGLGHGAVAAPDHDQLLALEQRPVTGCAVTHASTHEEHLAGDAKLLVLGARCEDDRLWQETFSCWSELPPSVPV